MRLIKPSFEICKQSPGLEGVYEAIERAGRTCYKSERPEGQTAKNFVDRMIKSGHNSMLEHGTVYLKMPVDVVDYYDDIDYDSYNIPIYNYKKYKESPYSKICINGSYCYITTNYRVLVENNWLGDLTYICKPTEFHEKRVTVRFTTDRGVSHELVRHRVFSFAQESTRYCNYSKDKFGNELTFIIPSWMDTVADGNTYSYDTHIDIWQKSEDANTSNFLQSIAWAEKNYLTLLYNGWTPQQARSVLPNCLKTELVMTGFVSDWNHLFRLRTSFIAETGKPHPDMSNLCDPLYKEFIEKGFMEEL